MYKNDLVLNGISEVQSDNLYHIVTADNELIARKIMFQTLASNEVAGAILYRLTLNNVERTPEIKTYWQHDFTGLVVDYPPEKALKSAICNAPFWLAKWSVDRGKPFWLQKYIRFIPFSSQAMLKLTSIGDAPPLADFIFTPYKFNGEHYVLTMGLKEAATVELANKLSELAIVYMSKAIDELVCDETNEQQKHDLFKLSERQLECFGWMAAGKSLQETSIIMGTSYANVRYHLEKAKRESGYASMQQVLVHVVSRYDLSPFGPEE